MKTLRKPTRRSYAADRSAAFQVLGHASEPRLDVDRLDSRPPRVVVVEFRDEVYAGLKGVLEEAGFQVERGRIGATAAARIRRFEPDLILVNEELPDESGWLMTCKLRLTRCSQPIWLYAVRKPRRRKQWREFWGADEVIEYRGVLAILLQHIRRRLADRRASSPVEPARRPLGSASPSAVA